MADRLLCSYAHPYEFEIINLQYPRSVYEQANPQPFSPLDASAATFVDTPQGVRAMLAELKLAREIAIDLEHHDTRSYVGLVSLMQISTRDKDWIVDTLKPWREDLQVLNEVFADPSILKVRIPPTNSDLGTNIPGISWRFHGYGVAPERSRAIRGWIVRHISCRTRSRISSSQPGVTTLEVHPFRC